MYGAMVQGSSKYRALRFERNDDRLAKMFYRWNGDSHLRKTSHIVGLRRVVAP